MRIFEMKYVHQERAIDPALMTFDEYYAVAKGKGKTHCSTAYEKAAKTVAKYNTREKFLTLLNNIIVNGIEFEVREAVEDRYEHKIVKWDKEENDVLRIDGEIQYFTRDELEKIIPEDQRYRYEHAIFLKGGECVAATQDEWGCLLVLTHPDYQGFGFGTRLVKLNRSKRPDRPSGGFTPQGYSNIRRVHASMVRDYMTDGTYTKLVKSGKLSAEKAREIIASVSDVKRQSGKNKKDYSTSPKDWLIFFDERSIIIYDKKLMEFYNEDPFSVFEQRMIIGVLMLGSYTNESPFISRLYAKNEKVKGFMIELMMADMTPEGESLRLDTDEIEAVHDRGVVLVRDDDAKFHDAFFLKSSDLQPKQYGALEKAWRRKHDQYDEFYHYVMDLADYMGREAINDKLANAA